VTFQPGNSFSSQGAGSYTITVKDANGCTKTTGITIAAAPPAITASAAAPGILCNGGTTTITVAAGGGTAPLQYSLDGVTFQPGNSFTSQVAGSYTITVKDANGCTKTTGITIAAAPPAITASAAAPAILCNGGTTTITVTAGGGTTPLQYSLDGVTFQPGNSFSSQGAGSYTITVKDANGCTKTTGITIAAAPPAITASAAAPGILCNGGTTITVSAGGGTAPLQYSLDGVTFQPGNSFTSQVAGSYTITVKDANGCTKTTGITISSTTGNNSQCSSTWILCNGEQPPSRNSQRRQAPLQYSLTG
jgi:guanyl-specific ribonuclease Sa